MRTLRTLTLTTALLLPTVPHTALAITISASQDASITNVAIGPSCGVSGDSTSARVGLLSQSSGKGTSSSKWRTLLHFDLSQIPHNATITQADLVLHIQSITGSPVVEIRRLTNSVWDETNVLWDVYACDADGSGPQQAGLWCTAGGDFTAVQAPPNWTPPGTGDQPVSVIDLVRKAAGQAANPGDPDTGGHLHLLLKTVGDSGGTFTFATTNQTSVPPPRIEVTWSGGDPPVTSPWVSFRDETATRLIISSVAADDPEEKDIATGDFDRDGDLDVIVVRKRPFSTFGPRSPLLLMNEDGVLQDRTGTLLGDSSGPIIATNARDVFVANFDGTDGPDLAVANTCEEPPTFYKSKGGRCGNWLGLTRQDSWLPPSLASPPGNGSIGRRFCAVWAGDVDGDAEGDLDLYMTNYKDTCSLGDPNPGLASPTDVLLINKIKGSDSTGRFEDESLSRLGSNAGNQFGSAVEIHDLDGNGPEIVKTCTKGCALSTGFDDVYILRNAGAGFYQASPLQWLDTVDPYMLTVADFDSDTLKDIYVVDDGPDELHRATTGPLTFAKEVVESERTDWFGGNVKAADIDRDGDPDIGVASVDVSVPCTCDTCELFEPFQSPRSFAVLRNDSGTFVDPWPTQADNQNFHLPRVHDLAFLDLNGDGCLDLFLATCGSFVDPSASNAYRVFIQDCTP